MLQLLLPIILILSLGSCSSDTTSKPDDSSASPVLTRPAASAVAPAFGPENTVRDFLNWYSKNQSTLPGNFVDHADGRDTTKSYSVNFNVTERWLAAVDSSRAVSPVYIRHWRTYFKQYADTLRLHKQHDGPPSGFEYDFLLLSQEPEEKVAELKAGTFITRLSSPNQAIVTAFGPQHEGWREGMIFILSRAPAGKWLIDEMLIPDNLTQ